MWSGATDDPMEPLRRACADHPAVAGLILHGSRSIPGFARADSDYDLVAVVDDLSASPWPWSGEPRYDVWEIALADWPSHAMPGRADHWNRFALVHARLIFERAGSGVAAALERKRRLSEDEARELAAAALDEYINNCYRSLKNERDGRHLEAMLDAAETVPALLRTVFAIHGRVRPYNRHLVWELTREPLPGTTLTGDELLAGVRALATGGGDPGTQRALLARVQQLAREHGHGDVVDSWEDKRDLLPP